MNDETKIESKVRSADFTPVQVVTSLLADAMCEASFRLRAQQSDPAFARMATALTVEQTESASGLLNWMDWVHPGRYKEACQVFDYQVEKHGLGSRRDHTR